jgi:hypothetical protein
MHEDLAMINPDTEWQIGETRPAQDSGLESLAGVLFYALLWLEIF